MLGSGDTIGYWSWATPASYTFAKYAPAVQFLLPVDVALSPPVFQNFLEHFVASLVRDACLDEYMLEERL